MNDVVPWAELGALIEPVYPKAGDGRPPVGLERMLRIYFRMPNMSISSSRLAATEPLRANSWAAAVRISSGVIPRQPRLNFSALLPGHS